jgi:hypothetical protein
MGWNYLYDEHRELNTPADRARYVIERRNELCDMVGQLWRYKQITEDESALLEAVEIELEQMESVKKLLWMMSK